MRGSKRSAACCVSVFQSLLVLPCHAIVTCCRFGDSACTPCHLHSAYSQSHAISACAAGNTADEHGFNLLRGIQVKEKVAAGQVPMAKYIITKQLTKRPEDYPDAKNQPHVQVALRRKAAGARNGVMQVCAWTSMPCWDCLPLQVAAACRLEGYRRSDSASDAHGVESRAQSQSESALSNDPRRAAQVVQGSWAVNAGRDGAVRHLRRGRRRRAGGRRWRARQGPCAARIPPGRDPRRQRQACAGCGVLSCAAGTSSFCLPGSFAKGSCMF